MMTHPCVFARCSMTNLQTSPPDVDRYDVVLLVNGGLGHCLLHFDAGVVDDDVESSDALDDAFDQFPPRVG